MHVFAIFRNVFLIKGKLSCSFEYSEHDIFLRGAPILFVSFFNPLCVQVNMKTPICRVDTSNLLRLSANNQISHLRFAKSMQCI